jgi:hypothetical protein
VAFQYFVVDTRSNIYASLLEATARICKAVVHFNRESYKYFSGTWSWDLMSTGYENRFLQIIPKVP